MFNAKKAALAGAAFLSVTLFAATAFAADPWGTWKRPDGSTASITKCGGKMCGKVASGPKAGFVMFKGIPKVSSNKWAGDMWHPKMGSWITFNGSVVLSGNSIKVKGCAVGNAGCDSETWTR